MSRMLILLLLAISTLTTHARLGETESELAKRFGQPTYQQNENIFAQGQTITIGKRQHFQRDNWLIAAIITEGRCSQISYTHQGDWTETQFATVLATNCQASKWSDTSPADANSRKIIRSWKRADGATANWSRPSNSMTVTNPAYLRTREKAEAKAKANAARVPKL